MMLFLRKITPFRRHIINTISPSPFHCLQNQRVLLYVNNLSYYSTSLSSNHPSFTVSYLIHTCGFSPQDAACVSNYLRLTSREKPDLVINFFKNLGFSKPQILRFTREVPLLLRCDPHKILHPKIEFFKSKGISSSHIPKLLCSCPSIMMRSLEKQLIPSFHFFQHLFQSDELFIKALTRFSGILVDHSTRALPNMKLLRDAGVPESNIIKLLQLYPSTITKCSHRFEMIVKEVQEMGFDPLKCNFVFAVYALASLRKCTWSRKADVYRKWGWSDDDIAAAFRSYPFCMKISEDKIDAMLKYLIHELGFDFSNFMKYPHVLAFSLKERIVPRGAVIQVLLSKGLVKREYLLRAFTVSEKDFLRRFVFRHEPEGSELLELYRSKLDLAKNVGAA